MLGVPVPPECTADPETLDAVPDSADEFLFIGNYREDRAAMRAFALPTFGGAYVRINLEGRELGGDRPARRVRGRVRGGRITDPCVSGRANW